MEGSEASLSAICNRLTAMGGNICEAMKSGVSRDIEAGAR
ncbi:hypothetical protein thalar_01108 [Litoreibacter arenae DSM 19593]|uniref:Uncharacterized protein n=1 Tax=Litoreibacter arenae DSM 19593 TaxID=1123360 RepID=S9QHE1_9RHOB|nr:hypothetical protein thalar_01108 [Litoreibacter arenae DSM 19593]